MEDAPSKFVLIVDSQPSVEDLHNILLKDLSIWELSECLRVEDLELKSLLWLVTELVVIGRSGRQAAEVLFGICNIALIHCGNVHRASDIGCCSIRFSLETLGSLHVDNSLDDV